MLDDDPYDPQRNWKMDPDIKAKWVAALRSGAYRQTKGKMRDGTGAMCCLGVLCDVVDPKGWTSYYGDNPMSLDPQRSIPHRHMASYPAQDISAKAGLSSRRSVQLSSLNDQGSTFAEIADVIEAWDHPAVATQST
jgi:hypothetical protein